MKAPIRHTMLVANAGSGKTHALTTRMVKLLALGVEPRRIAALTFTKKAAGEFLDAVFLRLAEAALDAGKLAELNAELNKESEEGAVPPLDAARCNSLLARLVSGSGSLTMGTIDGLFARIARSFPLESGLPGEFSMIGESELERARTEALAAIFRDSASAEAFLDLVRRIARRKGESKVFHTLLQTVKEFHGKYLLDTALPWGERSLIWPGGSCEILEAGEVRPAAQALWAEIVKTHPSLSAEAIDRWTANLELASAHKPGSAWPKELKEFIKGRLCSCSEDKKTGEEYLPTGRSADGRVYLRGSILELRRKLLLALLKPVYESLLEKSAAIRSFMSAFEESYHALTRRRGRMTFSDVTDLLAQQVGSLDWAVSAGYRLDARLDHWLLDEFQDTSRIQWRILSSFIDEVIQDNGGERSLFYVGDTKQAIYSWRGGDPGLFFEIFRHYNQGSEGRVFARDLNVSYRSASEILEVVNKVFAKETIRAHATVLGIPEKTVESWEEAWRGHERADMNKDLSGYVRWEAVESEEEDEDPIHRRIASILEEVQPWRRDLSCGVLTRKNGEAASIAALLQSKGIPVSLEGKSNPCNDNPLGIALLAAFRVAAFPGDTLSLALLRGSPLVSLLGEGVESFRASALRVIAEQGYEAAVRFWTSGLTLSPFLSRRAADFLAAAGEYDAAGRGAVSEFVSFMESHVVQEAEASGVVRVMTVHQSKGLTFDMTIVTGLDGKGSNNADILHLGGGEPPRWGSLLPSKDLAAPDPVMSGALAEIRSEEEYGKLCTAYVAMTRSRQALYLLTKKLQPNTTAKNFARLLMLALHPGADVIDVGDGAWFEKHPVGALPVADSRGESATLPPCTAGTPRALSPSSLTEAIRPVDRGQERGSFSPDAAELGTEIHEVLSRIGWDIRDADLGSCTPEARRLLKGFLSSAEARDLFTKPEGDWDCCNEQPFDLMIEGQWVSGIFDRLHIRRQDGQPVEARIFDYKTNRSTPDAIAKEYEGQMEQYRKATAKLFGIALEQVTARTVPIRQSLEKPSAPKGT